MRPNDVFGLFEFGADNAIQLSGFVFVIVCYTLLTIMLSIYTGPGEYDVDNTKRGPSYSFGMKLPSVVQNCT